MEREGRRVSGDERKKGGRKGEGVDLCANFIKGEVISWREREKGKEGP